jgi:putative sigma-54 modulation protein
MLRMALYGIVAVLTDMTHVHNSIREPKLLLRGLHLGLDHRARAFVEAKAERLFRHEPRILRLRIDVERDSRGRSENFAAKGRIEIAGPDLTASVTTESPAASVAWLIDKLDRMLRRRATDLLRRRGDDDIRAHRSLAASA